MKYAWIALMFGLLAACSDDASSPKNNTSNSNNTTSDTGSDTANDAGNSTAPDAVFVGVQNCEADADCNDGLTCTTDSCVEVAGEGKVCAWSLNENRCLIQGVCHNVNAVDPSGCGVCDPATPHAWSGAADGTACDDSNVCTFETTCQAGICRGTPIDCNDGESCTVDSCDPVAGCQNVAEANNTPCDDDSLCTQNDVCSNGVCGGEALACDDDNPCTDDTCDPAVGCSNTNNEAECDDGDPCTTGDTCSNGACESGGPETCDDSNACTIDICHPVAGCQHLPTNNPCCTGQVSICEDNDPCTTDICDPQTAECTYQLNTASCDDQDACTTGDTCNNGVCAGAPRSCDDGNDCTNDACNVNQGCFHTPINAGSCDDGLACSTGDACVAGTCVADVSQCVCTPNFSDASKVNSLVMGNGTNVGEALDVDGDGDRDNALSPLGTFVNQPLADALADGSLVLMFEYIGFQPGQFTLALLTGELAPNAMGCDVQMATCDYYADKASVDQLSCSATIRIPATRTGNFVGGGGPTTAVPIAIPLDAANTLNLTVYKARIEKTVTVDASGVVGFSGILAGAVTETDLNNAINSIDPASLPVPPMQLISLLGTLAPNDIDTDGNGTLDAKSIALKIGGIDGRLTGIAP